MSPRARWIAVVAGVVAVAVVAFLSRRAADDGEATSPPAAEVEKPPTLRAPPRVVARERTGTGSPEGSKEEAPPNAEAPETYSLKGRVLLPDGKPAVRAEVHARPAAWDPRARGMPTTSDATGAFGFWNLREPGEYALEAVLTEGGEWFGTATARADDPDVRLRLRVGVGPDTLLVRVIGADGAPVASAEGIFRTANGWGYALVERGRAFFEVDGRQREATAGAFVLVLNPKSADGTPTASGDARLDGVHAGGIFELRLPPESWLSGRVVAPDGRAVVGARLRAVRIDDGYYGQPAMRHFDALYWRGDDVVRSADDGSFRIGRIGDGEHWILVDPPAEFLRTQPVRAPSGAADLRIVLPEGTSAVIRVLDDKGNPLEGASIYAGEDARSMDHSWPRTFLGREKKTGVDGAAVLPNLERAARLVLTVKAPAATDDLLDHVERDWVPLDTTVRLQRGVPLAGFVRDTDGVAVGYGFVRCRESDGTDSRSQADKDGKFRFTAMRAGIVELTVEDAPAGSPGPVRLHAGRRDVVLTVAKPAPARR